MNKILTPLKNLKLDIQVPGDKSISHRGIIISSLAKGISTITGFSLGEDCISTVNCFRDLGVRIELINNSAVIYGNGLYGLKPSVSLYVGNSGTTIRLISGVLCAQTFHSYISGDASILKRPMFRIIEPLSQMGAQIQSDSGFPPLHISGHTLQGINYTLPVPSAQVKSSILLAALYADSTTTITENQISRNHTEIMLKNFGADIKVCEKTIILNPSKELHSNDIVVPGDFSSAAFFIVAATILPDSEVLIKNVGVNPTRTGLLTVLEQMGANIKIKNQRQICGEEVADIYAYSSKLTAVSISGEIIPTIIDELPIFTIAALFAEGISIIRNAEELKIKESNRIHALFLELSKMGALVQELPDGLIIQGTPDNRLNPATVDSHNDHRIAMSLVIASFMAKSEVVLTRSSCIDISFPGFFDLYSPVNLHLY